eukprot:450172-Rhodomonas_salina.1
MVCSCHVTRKWPRSGVLDAEKLQKAAQQVSYRPMPPLCDVRDRFLSLYATPMPCPVPIWRGPCDYATSCTGVTGGFPKKKVLWVPNWRVALTHHMALGTELACCSHASSGAALM